MSVDKILSDIAYKSFIGDVDSLVDLLNNISNENLTKKQLSELNSAILIDLDFAAYNGDNDQLIGECAKIKLHYSQLNLKVNRRKYF